MSPAPASATIDPITGFVVQRGLHLRRRNLLLILVSIVVIYSMFLPLLFADISCRIYQALYFSLRDIPKARRNDYIVHDRAKLHSLNWIGKLNCWYCEYANGLAAWIKVIINRTEAYSCAIKHARSAQGQEHARDFYEYKEFD